MTRPPDFALLAVQGPEADQVVAQLSPLRKDGAGWNTLTYYTFTEAQLLGHDVLISATGYTGAGGVEIYMPLDAAQSIWEAFLNAGVQPCGLGARDTLRMEMGYRHWGHDITPDDSPLEAGLGFAVAFEKQSDFLGREALLRSREAGLDRRMLAFALEDPDPLLFHDEAIWRDDRLVGRITSGAYGHSLGRALALGYVEWAPGDRAADLEQSEWEIEIACQRHPARASLRPFYDPTSKRLRS